MFWGSRGLCWLVALLDQFKLHQILPARCTIEVSGSPISTYTTEMHGIFLYVRVRWQIFVHSAHGPYQKVEGMLERVSSSSDSWSELRVISSISESASDSMLSSVSDLSSSSLSPGALSLSLSKSGDMRVQR